VVVLRAGVAHSRCRRLPHRARTLAGDAATLDTDSPGAPTLPTVTSNSPVLSRSWPSTISNRPRSARCPETRSGLQPARARDVANRAAPAPMRNMKPGAQRCVTEPRQKGQPVALIVGQGRPPELGRMVPGNEPPRVVDRHQDDDQTAQGVEGRESGRARPVVTCHHWTSGRSMSVRVLNVLKNA